MNTQRVRLLAGIALTGFAIAGSPAVRAELPQLEPTQQVSPTAAEIAADTDDVFFFGQTVAIDGNTAMVEMPEYGTVPGYTHVRIAIYNRAPSGHWNRTGTLEPEPGDAFEFSILLKDGTAFIQGNRGIYVFRQNHGVWTRIATLFPPPSSRPISFGGESIRYDNGTVAFAATYTDDFSGTVFLYRLNAAGHVTGPTQLFASDVEPVKGFGARLDMVDDTLVAGGYTSTGGGVYVFHRVGNQWLQTQKLTQPVSDPSTAFGSSVALNRGALLIGDLSARSGGGSVYVFTGINALFSYRTELHPTPDQLSDYWSFGTHIVTDGDRAVISAYEPPSYLYANGVAVVYERHGDEAVATHIARFYYPHAMSISGNRLLLGSPYYVDYDDYSFHQIGWADFYTLPAIASHP